MTPWLWALGGIALAGSYELLCRRREPTTGRWPARRRWAWMAAVALLTVVGLPPLAGMAHRHIWAETLQFAVAAFGAGPLVALAAPVGLVRGRGRPRRPEGDGAQGWRVWAPAFGAFLVVTVGWRLPFGADAAASGPGWLALEVVTLTVGTWWLWAALVGSPPRPALVSRIGRVALGAVTAWSVWVFDWGVGFTAHPFYPSFAGSAGAVGSQEIAVTVLWVVSAASLLPVIFTNLVGWLNADLRAGEDEMKLHRRTSHA